MFESYNAIVGDTTLVVQDVGGIYRLSIETHYDDGSANSEVIFLSRDTAESLAHDLIISTLPFKE